MWKVTAGRSNYAVRDFLEKGVVAIGYSGAKNFIDVSTKKELTDRFAAVSPDDAARSVQVRAAQAWRFLHEVKIGDAVLTYDPVARTYHLGEIKGLAEYRPDLLDDLSIVRAAQWTGSVSRDVLSASTRNSLGAILTIFKLPPAAAREVADLALGKNSIAPAELSEEVEPAESLDPFADLADQALERVKDRILALEWDEMQELVAALLRALGYRTIVSPAGADRGRDIIASRDGFGFEAPRIVVEVKHRRGPMGAPEVRAFLGGRHADDRGLYVSTGGFTREAQYEAERAATVTHLMTLDGLARALLEQYEQLDQQGRRLLPLTKLYWPS